MCKQHKQYVDHLINIGLTEAAYASSAILQLRLAGNLIYVLPRFWVRKLAQFEPAISNVRPADTAATQRHRPDLSRRLS